MHAAHDSVGALEVISHNTYRTAEGSGVMGVIENTGSDTYTLVEVEVVVYDDGGDVLYEFIDETEEEEIDGLFRPGERWRFNVEFEEADFSEVTSYTITVEGALADDEEIDEEPDPEDDDAEPDGTNGEATPTTGTNTPETNTADV